MATQRLFLYGIQKTTHLGNSFSTSYKFDGEQLSIFWKGRKKSVAARVGDVFCIECNGNFPRISKMKLPRNNYKLILWLCGFYGYNSAIESDKFQEMLENRRNELDWWGYEEYGPYTDEYALRICNRSDCGGVYHVAGFVNKDTILTREKVIEILNAYSKVGRFYIPKKFIKEVLRKRFCMDELDFEQIHFE